jgi:hypothetical protein
VKVIAVSVPGVFRNLWPKSYICPPTLVAEERGSDYGDEYLERKLFLLLAYVSRSIHLITACLWVNTGVHFPIESGIFLLTTVFKPALTSIQFTHLKGTGGAKQSEIEMLAYFNLVLKLRMLKLY